MGPVSHTHSPRGGGCSVLVCRISPDAYMHNKARASPPQIAPGVGASTASAVVSPPADGPDPQSPTYEAGPLPFYFRESAITARTSERSCTTRPGGPAQYCRGLGDSRKLLVAPPRNKLLNLRMEAGRPFFWKVFFKIRAQPLTAHDALLCHRY